MEQKSSGASGKSKAGDLAFVRGITGSAARRRVILFITSKGTLDKLDSTLRGYVAERAEFLGTIRLPNTTFKQNANTEVTADIVMLRKVGRGETNSSPDWRGAVNFTNRHGETFLRGSFNRFFSTPSFENAPFQFSLGTVERWSIFPSYSLAAAIFGP